MSTIADLFKNYTQVFPAEKFYYIGNKDVFNLSLYTALTTAIGRKQIVEFYIDDDEGYTFIFFDKSTITFTSEEKLSLGAQSRQRLKQSIPRWSFTYEDICKTPEYLEIIRLRALDITGETQKKNLSLKFDYTHGDYTYTNGNVRLSLGTSHPTEISKYSKYKHIKIDINNLDSYRIGLQMIIDDMNERVS